MILNGVQLPAHAAQKVGEIGRRRGRAQEADDDSVGRRAQSVRLSVGSLRHEVRFSGPGGSENDERVPGAVGRGEVIVKFGRHVLGFT